MKAYLTTSAALLVGLVVGGIATQGLHAQSKPMVYMISEIDVTNPDKYATEYASKMQTVIKNAGGKLIVIGGVAGAGAKPVIALDGTAPKRVTVQVWESTEALKKWYDSAERQELQKVGDQHAKFRRFAVEGQ
jgi:uncharacterized protein (DUF1330 family)